MTMGFPSSLFFQANIPRSQWRNKVQELEQEERSLDFWFVFILGEVNLTLHTPTAFGSFR